MNSSDPIPSIIRSRTRGDSSRAWSTNAIESVNDKIATYARRVKRWRGGEMILRWVGAAVLDAAKGFRRVKGHREMHRLVDALRRHEKSLHSETEAA